MSNRRSSQWIERDRGRLTEGAEARTVSRQAHRAYLQRIVGVTDSAPGETVARFSLVMDGRVIFSTDKPVEIGRPVIVTANISDGSGLDLHTDGSSSSCDWRPVWGDVRLS